MPASDTQVTEDDRSGLEAASFVAPTAGAAKRANPLDNQYVSLIAQIVVVAVIHRSLWFLGDHSCSLPYQSYLQPSMVKSALEHPPFAILIALALPPLIFRWKRIRWRDIDPKARTRLFVMVPVLLFAWVCSLYDMNLAYDQPHLDGRLMVVLLAIGCWFHPVFVCAFVLWIMVVIMQIHAPLPYAQWHWADKTLPFDTLVLFSAYLHVRAWSRPHHQLFAFLVLVLTGVTYAYAAYRKMIIGPTALYWPLENHFGFLFIGANLNGGWFRNLATEDVLSVAALLEQLSPLMGSATILCEGAGLALLWHRRSTLPILFAITGMHAIILLSTGIFFWKWIVQNCALAAYLTALNRDAAADPGARVHRVLALVPARLAIPMAVALMLSAEFVFLPLRFAWLDSPVTNYFEIRARGVSGATYRLEPRFFAPYDVLMTQSRFYYLTQRPVLAGTFGTTYDLKMLKAVEHARVDDLPAIRSQYGQVHWDKASMLIFAEFVQRSVSNAQRRGTRGHPLKWLSPPYHFQTMQAADAYTFQEPIEDVEVRWHEWFYDGSELHHTLDEPIMRVPIRPRP